MARPVCRLPLAGSLACSFSQPVGPVCCIEILVYPNFHSVPDAALSAPAGFGDGVWPEDPRVLRRRWELQRSLGIASLRLACLGRETPKTFPLDRSKTNRDIFRAEKRDGCSPCIGLCRYVSLLMLLRYRCTGVLSLPLHLRLSTGI